MVRQLVRLVLVLVLCAYFLLSTRSIVLASTAENHARHATPSTVALSATRQLQHARATGRQSFAAGAYILIQATNLPRPAGTLCVGLSSLIDQGSIPMNLGRMHATAPHAGSLRTRIPAKMIGPEPAGAYLIFIGDCATPAPMGQYASTVIDIHA